MQLHLFRPVHALVAAATAAARTRHARWPRPRESDRTIGQRPRRRRETLAWATAAVRERVAWRAERWWHSTITIVGGGGGGGGGGEVPITSRCSRLVEHELAYSVALAKSLVPGRVVLLLYYRFMIWILLLYLPWCLDCIRHCWWHSITILSAGSAGKAPESPRRVFQ